MLNQHYMFYLLKTAEAALQTLSGALAIFLLAVAIFAFIKLKGGKWIRGLAIWSALLVAVYLFSTAFGNAVYEFEEHPETLVSDLLPAGEPDCGVHWSGFIRSGYGMGNPCPPGCYRGTILRKQMRMRGLPPWPEYRREMQCWKRD